MVRDEIVEQVVRKYQGRSEVGIKKYQTTLQQNNRDDYFKHLQEELMDATLYLEKLMTMQKKITDLVREHPNDAELGYLIRELVK